ncbi:FadR/GntR family transcriptional regulator [Oceanomicrobium pacificus]|uniref:FCD domain-containing protein n=1 Tax=Oceanomicrobium pacificus TaxID=2692916 RepID=A0A6B0TVZ5_9RHOB|nr:FCD domain-containing protein [Oceanomicrobium pacificus]MXU65163.1 FCD domain-containing protein [Oceanomicrobium pacificus]
MPAQAQSVRPVGRSSRDWTLADQVYDRLITLIADGTFPEHSKLPTETSLSEQFGVSRPVLRQALKRLREEGLILSRQGSGSYVQRRPDSEQLDFAPVGSIADIQRTFEFRRTIECAAASLSASRATAEQIDRIAAALAQHAGLPDDGSEQAAVDLSDEQFHTAIFAGCENHYFLAARTSLQPQIAASMTLSRGLAQGDVQIVHRQVLAEHEAILAAIRDRDADAAAVAMCRHLDAERGRMFEGLPAGV